VSSVVLVDYAGKAATLEPIFEQLPTELPILRSEWVVVSWSVVRVLPAIAVLVDTATVEQGLFDPNVSRSILRERAAQDQVRQGRPRADQRPRVLAFEAA